jgi:uncharacterized delta-60 repeat protein
MASRRLRKGAAALAVTLAMVAGPTLGARADDPPGSLDTTFSGDGRATVAFGAHQAFGEAMALQGNRILVMGEIGSEEAADVAVTRLHANGTLDRTFGGGDGKFSKDLFGEGDRVSDGAVLPGGKILLVGGTATPTGDRALLLRLNPNGSLDTTFGGGDGVVTTSMGSGFSFANALAVMSDGRLVVCGVLEQTDPAVRKFVLARYRPGGKLDPSFSGNGKAVIKFGSQPDSSCAAIAVTGGKIVAAGFSGAGFQTSVAVARLTASGGLDQNFGNRGRKRFNFQDSDRATDLAALPDGKVLVAGVTTTPSMSEVLLIRLLSNGSPDTAFGGGDGIVVDQLPGHTQTNLDQIARQADGRIVAVGTASSTMFVARYGPLGKRDPSFASAGVQDSAWPDGLSIGTEPAIDTNGKILAAGTEQAGGSLLMAVERLLS